jgi:hypothetical protein
MFSRDLGKQSSRWKGVLDIEHTLPPAHLLAFFQYLPTWRYVEYYLMLTGTFV